MDQRYMSSTLYKAATAGDVHYLSSSNIELKEIKVSSDTVSDSGERNKRLRCHDLLSLTPEENNCLHIAARFGHEEFVQEVLNVCPSLLYQQNKKGDKPLHVAARAGHLGIVKLLTDSSRRLQFPREADQEEEETIIQNEESSTALSLADSVQPPPPTTSDQSQNNIRRNSATTSGGDDITCDRSLTEAEGGERPSSPIWWTQIQQNTNSIQPHRSSTQIGSTRGTVTRTTTSEWPSLPIWLTQNHDGNTALHEALRNKHQDMAWYLLDLDSEQVVLVVNAKNESPLYLAAEAGFVAVLEKILRAGGSNNSVGPRGQTPLHAAVFAGSTESISVLNRWIPGLTRKQDLYGKTALYYATQANSTEIMRLLMNLDASSAYIWDNEGLSPLLVAASIGSSASVRAILDAFPASIEYSDYRGYNALHLAVINSSMWPFLELLKMPEMMTLINEPDKEGNTPLHLAIMNHFFWKANALLSAERMDLKAKNNLGHTVLDACVLEAPIALFAGQRRLWYRLKKKGAPLGLVRPLMQLRAKGPSYISTKWMDAMNNQSQLLNTVSVVAALLATITFAAPFTIPGGYSLSTEGSKSKSNVGYSFLIQKPALTLFLLIDTTAFVLSMVTLLLLLMAAFNRKAFLRAAVHYAVAFVTYAIYAAMFAFISGLYAVTSGVFVWVAILICIIGSSLGILHLWTFQLASNESVFLPGLARRKIEMPDEKMAQE